jgi:diacylglycerol kinase family enzyme
MTAALRVPELLAFERMAFDSLPVATEPRPRTETATGPQRVVVLVNADAGRVQRLGRPKVERWVRRALGGRLLELQWVHGPGLEAALARAVAARPDVLAVIGGDGTARSALEATAGRVPVAPLPGGTLNLLSRAVWGRQRLRACLRALPHGVERRLPAGRIGERRFYVVCGFGPLMELDALREDLRAGRRLAASWARLAALGARGFRDALSWSTPGEPPRPASALVVALGPVDAAFGLGRRAAPRLMLEAAGTRLEGWADLAGLGARVLTHRWRARAGLTTRQSRRFEVEGLGGPVFGLLDGERCRLPERFAVEHEPAAALVWGPA